LEGKDSSSYKELTARQNTKNSAQKKVKKSSETLEKGADVYNTSQGNAKAPNKGNNMNTNLIAADSITAENAAAVVNHYADMMSIDIINADTEAEKNSIVAWRAQMSYLAGIITSSIYYTEADKAAALSSLQEEIASFNITD